jgi:hypothetical protein
MEKRRSRRIKINLMAEHISGDEKYGVFIENISAHGIQILATPSKKHERYTPGMDIDLTFLIPSGKAINLQCKIKWAHLKVPPNGMTDSIGLEIIDPPKQFVEFVKALH